MELRDRHVLITGGSQGIGAAMARSFARAGAHVTVAARSAEKLRAVADEIDGNVFVIDLLDERATDSCIAEVQAEFGPVDVLVNNAGVETTTAAAVISPAEIRQCNRLNVEVPEILTRHALPGMLRRGRGHVVFVSSLAGTASFPGMSIYAGSKAAIFNYAGSVRRELQGSPVHVTIVAPGPVDTDMWDHVETASPSLKRMVKRFNRLRLLPKADPDDLAEMAVAAVVADKRHVRLPRRLGVNFLLNEGPRRIVEFVTAGVRFDPLDGAE